MSVKFKTTFMIEDGWRKSGTLAFIPNLGMNIDVDGNYREVVDVYWSIEEPNMLTVYVSADNSTDKALKSWGWKKL